MNLRFATLAAALAALAASCAGSGGGDGSIRFLVFGDPPEINAYRTLIRAFEQEEPDIDLQLIEASDREDLLAKLSTSLAGGSPPDLFLMNYRFYGQFAAREVLEPLGPYADDSDEFELDEFYPQAVDAFRWNGDVTCLPQNISSLVVYFNRDLFRRFGVPPPTNGMRWPEFVDRAALMTRDARGQIVRGADPDLPSPNTAQAEIYGLGVEPTIIRIAPFVWSNGGEVVDDEERPTGFALDSIEARLALQSFLELRTAHGVVPSDQEVEAEIYVLWVEPTIIRIAPFVWSNGGEVVDDEERPTGFALDSIEARLALQSFLELRTVHGVVPSDQEVEAEDDESRFANGRLAMLLGSRRSVPTFREAAKFDWDVVSLPVFREPAGILHSDAYCLTKASNEKDAAWRFVEFALGPKGAPVVARAGRTVPSLRSVAESDAFLDPRKKPASSRVFLDGIETIRRVPTISTWPEIEDVSDGILENGMYLGHPVDRVVAELDKKTRPLFERGEQ